MGVDDGFQVVNTESVYSGPVVAAETVTIQAPDGTLIERQVLRHPGAVAVVAVHDGDVVLIRQYRAAIDANLLEIPAGKRDIVGEPLVETARRELIEEVGLVPAEMVEMGTFYTAVGFCDEALTVFAAWDCKLTERQVDGVEEEHSELVRVPVGEIGDWLNDGRLTDAKTLIGLSWARDRGYLKG